MQYYAMRSNSSVSVKMKCDGAVYQLSMLMSNFDDEILTHSLGLICPY